MRARNYCERIDRDVFRDGDEPGPVLEPVVFAAFLLIAMAGLALGESAALSDSYRQIILSVTAAVCVAMAFAALILELLEKAERLEAQAQELTNIGEALRESEGRLLDFALTSSDWFWETDSHHRLVYVSEGVRPFGLDGARWVGKTHWEIDLDTAMQSDMWRDHMGALKRREIFRDMVSRCQDDHGARHDICISVDPCSTPRERSRATVVRHAT
jgi:hypothetical protein